MRGAAQAVAVVLGIFIELKAGRGFVFIVEARMLAQRVQQGLELFLILECIFVERAFKAYREMDYTGQWENRGKSWDFFADPYKEGRFKDEDSAYFSLSPGMDEVVGAPVRSRFHDYIKQEANVA